MAANIGPLPIFFAQFQNDKDGTPTTLRLTFADGQACDFTREEDKSRTTGSACSRSSR